MKDASPSTLPVILPSDHPCAWGIGLGRTGTTSLCKAFEILGYHPVAHNPPFDVLLKCRAAADNGCTIFFKFLDYRHPGSKFILTVREIDSWLASFERLHRYIKRPNRLDVDAVLRRMTLYETVDFDRQKYIDAYRRHYDDVHRYFRSRPNDLLKINIIEGDGWDKLCPFLSLPIPAQTFPHQFSMKEVQRLYGGA